MAFIMPIGFSMMYDFVIHYFVVYNCFFPQIVLPFCIILLDIYFKLS
jgi:hypothetical protein